MNDGYSPIRTTPLLGVWPYDGDDRRCRICGCGEHSACIGKDGRPCHWATEDLCSVCAEQLAGSTAIEPALGISIPAPETLNPSDVQLLNTLLDRHELTDPGDLIRLYTEAQASAWLRKRGEC